MSDAHGVAKVCPWILVLAVAVACNAGAVWAQTAVQTSGFKLSYVRVEGSVPLVPGETVTISATVHNVGMLSATETVWLELDGARVGETTLSLSGGKSECVSFTRTFYLPGVYATRVHTQEGYGECKVPVRSVELVRTLSGQKGEVSSVAFSPDGKTLASGSGFPDNAIKLWDTATGTILRSLSGHTGDVECIAFSRDGKILASGSGLPDYVIKLWDLATGTLLSSLSGHTSNVNSIAFSPDGKILASGSTDRTIKLWNVATGVF